jgi:PKD repeat protein
MLQATSSDPPDLILHLGDIAYESGTDSEFTTKHFAVYQNILLNTPLYPAFGNHEAVSSGATLATGPYFEAHVLPTSSGTEAYYSFDYANVHFIALDSQESSRAPGSAMLNWLQADLASTNQEWIIAYFHHPPYSKGSHNSDSAADSGARMVEMRENVLPILEAGGVDLVLSGHSHGYERSYFINSAYGYGASPNFATPDFPTLVSNGDILDNGNGNPAGDGAYLKNPDANQGAVYVVAGHGGRSPEGSGAHPVMVFSEFTANGSVLFDVNGNVLTLRNLRADGVISDVFSMDKSGTSSTNRRPIVNAGADQIITLPSSANLDGTVSDDGLPSPPSLSTTWTKVSGLGTVTFGNASAVDTTASFSEAGTYVLRLTANDSALSSSDDVTVSVNSSSGGGPVTITIEAESGGLTAPMAVRSDSQASGGQYVEVPQGMGNNSNDATRGGPGQVSFSINIPQAGTYALWARVLAADSNNDSFYVTSSGSLLLEWDIPDSSSWRWRKVIDVTRSAGIFNLEFRQREDGTKLDQIILTDDLSFVPDDDPAPPGNQAPNGVIDTPATNVNITVGQSVNFTGTGSDADNNTPLTFLWNFGTGSGIANSTAQDPGSVTFNNAGTFTVTFTVTDALGLADPTPATRTVTVTTSGGSNQAPNGVIDTPASDVSITVGQSVNFTGTGSDPDNNTPLTYLWNFGTGSGIANSTAQDPGSVTFNNAGTFTVTFTVTDALGLADPTPASRTVTVTGSGGDEVITVEAETGTLTAPMAIAFDSQASGGQYVEVPQGMGNNSNDATRGGPGQVSFSINIPQAGTYALWARVLAADSNNDSFYVTSSGSLLLEWDIPDSSSWRWRKVIDVTRSAGIFNLEFRQREDGTKLDQIILTDDLSFVPG